MTTRVDQYEGKLRIRTGPCGTTINIVVPLRTMRDASPQSTALAADMPVTH
jgi:hypothetical protein